MALPLTGQISFGDVNVELGRSRTALISLKNAETGVYIPLNVNSPYKPSGTEWYLMSEWRGYDQNYVPPMAYCTIWGDCYQVPSAGDNFIQITDLATDTVVFEYWFTNGFSWDGLAGEPVNLVIGNNYTFSLFREDLNGDFAGGTTYLGLNNDSYSIDLSDSQSFTSGGVPYCQSTFDCLIPDSQNLYLYFTSDYF